MRATTGNSSAWLLKPRMPTRCGRKSASHARRAASGSCCSGKVVVSKSRTSTRFPKARLSADESIITPIGTMITWCQSFVRARRLTKAIRRGDSRRSIEGDGEITRPRGAPEPYPARKREDRERSSGSDRASSHVGPALRPALERTLDFAPAILTPDARAMAPEPSTPTPRTRLDARTVAWLIAQGERVHELELAHARLQGELAASERIERASQRYADKLEEKLTEARKREASLARALGYAEAQRDQLTARLGEGRPAPLPELVDIEIVPAARPGVSGAPGDRAVSSTALSTLQDVDESPT